MHQCVCIFGVFFHAFCIVLQYITLLRTRAYGSSHTVVLNRSLRNSVCETRLCFLRKTSLFFLMFRLSAFVFDSDNAFRC